MESTRETNTSKPGTRNFDELVKFYLQEREAWQKDVALAEERAKNTIKRSARDLKMDLYILGFGILNLKPNEISETQIKNFRYYIHAIYDELSKLGLIDDDETRM